MYVRERLSSRTKHEAIMIRRMNQCHFMRQEESQVFKEDDFSKELEDVKGNYFYSKRMRPCTLSQLGYEDDSIDFRLVA